MSSNSSPPDANKTGGRAPRQKRLSARAQAAKDDGEVLLGLDDHQAHALPASDNCHINQPAQSSPLQSDSTRADTLRSSKMVPRKPAAGTTPKKPPVTAPDGTILPTFSRDTFQIYAWPAPAPKHFFKLSDQLRAWKHMQDAQVPDDDGSDDWGEFAGNVEHYPPGSSRENAIARVFINRAKRAARDGVSWHDFELVELQLDSLAAAKAERDPVRRRLRMEEDLDNDLRLAVLEQLKVRLCNEIWLQIYTGKPADNKIEAAGSQEAMVKRDSLFQNPEGLPLAEQNAVGGDNSERSTRGWFINDAGTPQPIFNDDADLDIDAEK